MRKYILICGLIGAIGCSAGETSINPNKLDLGVTDARVDAQAVQDAAVDMTRPDMAILDAAAHDAAVDAGAADSSLDATGPGTLDARVTDAAEVDATIIDATLADMAPRGPSRVGQNCDAAQPCEPDLLCLSGTCAEAPVIYDSWAIWANGHVQAGVRWRGPWLRLVVDEFVGMLGLPGQHDPARDGRLSREFPAPDVPEHVEVQVEDGTVVARIPVVVQQTTGVGEACTNAGSRWQELACEPGSMCAFEPTDECPSTIGCPRPHPGVCRVPDVAAVLVDDVLTVRVQVPQLTAVDSFYAREHEGPRILIRKLWFIQGGDGVGLYQEELSTREGRVDLMHDGALLLAEVMPGEQRTIEDGGACVPFDIEAVCRAGQECIDGACRAPEQPVIDTIAAVADADGFAIRVTGRAAEESLIIPIRLRADGHPVYDPPAFGDLMVTSISSWDGGRFEAVSSGPDPLPFDPAEATVEVVVNGRASNQMPLAPHLVQTADLRRGGQDARCDFREAILPCAAPLRCFSHRPEGGSFCDDVTIECVPSVDGDLELDMPIRIDDLPGLREHPHPANSWSSCDPVPREARARYFNFTAVDAAEYIFSVGSGGPAHFAIRSRCEDGRSELACMREPRGVDGVHTVSTTMEMEAGQTVTMMVLQQDWIVVEIERVP